MLSRGHTCYLHSEKCAADDENNTYSSGVLHDESNPVKRKGRGARYEIGRTSCEGLKERVKHRSNAEPNVVSWSSKANTFPQTLI